MSKEQVSMCRTKKPLELRLSNLRRMARRSKLAMPCIHIVRDPLTKRVVNVVKNPNSPQFLEEVGSWEMGCEYMTEEEYLKLPTCRVCGCWVEICSGLHILNQSAASMRE